MTNDSARSMSGAVTAANGAKTRGKYALLIMPPAPMTDDAPPETVEEKYPQSRTPENTKSG